MKTVPWDVDRRCVYACGFCRRVWRPIRLLTEDCLYWRENTLVEFWGFEPREAVVELFGSLRVLGRPCPVFDYSQAFA